MRRYGVVCLVLALVVLARTVRRRPDLDQLRKAGL